MTAYLYADADGRLVRVIANANEMAAFGPPAEYAEALEFDAATNRAVLDGISAEQKAHRLTGGVLTRRGAVVSIAADSPGRQERRALLAAEAALLSYEGLASPTLVQTSQVVKLHCRMLRRLVREVFETAEEQS